MNANGAPERSSPVVNLAVFTLALVLGSQGVARLMPPPAYFREKLMYFEEHKDEFDLVFFGSSETHWGLWPEVFDDHLREHGIELRSYNLAVEGFTGYEIDYMIRRVLAMEPARLKYAIISWRPWRTDREEHIHEQQIWWHSLTEMMLLLRGLWIDSISTEEKIRIAKLHTEDALRKFAHLGLGPNLVDYWRDPPGAGKGKWDYIAEHRGFEGLTEETDDRFWPRGIELREGFLENVDAFLEETQNNALRLRHLRENPEEAEAHYLATLFPRAVFSTQAQVEWLRLNDVKAIYNIPPTNENDQLQRRMHLEGYLPVLISFKDPAEYPVLFDPQYRYDALHLTEEGARLYSRYAAESFAGLLESGALGATTAKIQH